MAEDDFAENDVRRLAGARSYERGLGYLDAVSGLRATDGRITASVDGSERYRVVLQGSGALRGTCDCPYGEEGNFCKHLVAVALTVLRDPARVSASRREAALRDAALDRWLDGLGREELLALVRERAAEDEDFRVTLSLRAATVGGDTAVVLAGIRSLVDAAEFSRYGCIGYEEAAGYAARVARAAEAIRELAAGGQGAAAVAAAREAIADVVSVYESVDDSDGCLADAVDQLTQAHHAACAAGPPDPEGTARWLVDHLLGDGGELFDVRVGDYRGVLGIGGLARLRALGDEALRRNPRGWAEKDLMKSLARADRDVDALITLHARDLATNGHTHLVIAAELDAAGRTREALEWGERGLRYAADHDQAADVRLVDHLAARYAQDGRYTDAVTVRRNHFRSDRSLTAFRALRATATAAGCWDIERPRAFDLLRTDSEADRGYGRGPVLIDALIEDDDLDAAWTAADDLAGPDQWLTLADRSADARPADALPVYLRAVAARVVHTGDANYQRIADLLTKVRTCHEALGTLDSFSHYLADLRTEQKRKRNLLRVLDQRGL